MRPSARTQYIVSIAAISGAVLSFAYPVPFAVTVVFTTLCIGWGAWIFVSVLRSGDELQSASVRYAMAAASGIGAPLSLAFVMLMVATPGIQRVVTGIAAYSNSGLSPAAIGFALGITFTVMVLCAVLVVGHSLWWASKR